MEHTFENLKKMTVAQLREIAAGIEHEAVKGFSQLNKEHLLKALCAALNISMHQEHHVEGIDKAGIKAKIHQLKIKRDEFINAHDHKNLKSVRRRIHWLKRELHKATV
jgi:hypothetical protein